MRKINPIMDFLTPGGCMHTGGEIWAIVKSFSVMFCQTLATVERSRLQRRNSLAVYIDTGLSTPSG